MTNQQTKVIELKRDNGQTTDYWSVTEWGARCIRYPCKNKRMVKRMKGGRQRTFAFYISDEETNA